MKFQYLLSSIPVMDNAFDEIDKQIPPFNCLTKIAAVPRFAVRNLSFRRSIANTISADYDAPTVAYLINSCGLSPESAAEASQKLKLRSSDRADSVLELLRTHEFSAADISKLVRRHPLILAADAEKTLLPKLEFFTSKGISRFDLARTVSYDPSLLKISLKNQIIPSYNFLKALLISDERVISILKYKPWIFLDNLSKNVMPNIGLLRALGMPESSIALLLAQYPNILMKKHELFSEIVNEVKEFGFEPAKSNFMPAMRVMSGKKSILKRNQEAYRKCGWSEDEILSAFRSNPLCMTKSEKKITETIDFLVNKMGWSSAAIAKCATVMCLSLERRIVPRCSVFKVLVAKGLEKENLRLSSVVYPAEKQFLERFVSRHEVQVPQLLLVYQGKVDFQDVLIN